MAEIVSLSKQGRRGISYKVCTQKALCENVNQQAQGAPTNKAPTFQANVTTENPAPDRLLASDNFFKKVAVAGDSPTFSHPGRKSKLTSEVKKTFLDVSESRAQPGKAAQSPLRKEPAFSLKEPLNTGSPSFTFHNGAWKAERLFPSLASPDLKAAITSSNKAQQHDIIPNVDFDTETKPNIPEKQNMEAQSIKDAELVSVTAPNILSSPQSNLKSKVPRFFVTSENGRQGVVCATDLSYLHLKKQPVKKRTSLQSPQKKTLSRKKGKKTPSVSPLRSSLKKSESHSSSHSVPFVSPNQLSITPVQDAYSYRKATVAKKVKRIEDQLGSVSYKKQSPAKESFTIAPEKSVQDIRKKQPDNIVIYQNVYPAPEKKKATKSPYGKKLYKFNVEKPIPPPGSPVFVHVMQNSGETSISNSMKVNKKTQKTGSGAKRPSTPHAKTNSEKASKFSHKKASPRQVKRREPKALMTKTSPFSPPSLSTFECLPESQPQIDENVKEWTPASNLVVVESTSNTVFNQNTPTKEDRHHELLMQEIASNDLSSRPSSMNSIFMRTGLANIHDKSNSKSRNPFYKFRKINDSHDSSLDGFKNVRNNGRKLNRKSKETEPAGIQLLEPDVSSDTSFNNSAAYNCLSSVKAKNYDMIHKRHSELDEKRYYLYDTTREMTKTPSYPIEQVSPSNSEILQTCVKKLEQITGRKRSKDRKTSKTSYHVENFSSPKAPLKVVSTKSFNESTRTPWSYTKWGRESANTSKKLGIRHGGSPTKWSYELYPEKEKPEKKSNNSTINRSPDRKTNMHKNFYQQTQRSPSERYFFKMKSQDNPRREENIRNHSLKETEKVIEPHYESAKPRQPHNVFHQGEQEAVLSLCGYRSYIRDRHKSRSRRAKENVFEILKNKKKINARPQQCGLGNIVCASLQDSHLRTINCEHGHYRKEEKRRREHAEDCDTEANFYNLISPTTCSNINTNWKISEEILQNTYRGLEETLLLEDAKHLNSEQLYRDNNEPVQIIAKPTQIVKEAQAKPQLRLGVPQEVSCLHNSNVEPELSSSDESEFELSYWKESFNELKPYSHGITHTDRAFTNLYTTEDNNQEIYSKVIHDPKIFYELDDGDVYTDTSFFSNGGTNLKIRNISDVSYTTNNYKHNEPLFVEKQSFRPSETDCESADSDFSSSPSTLYQETFENVDATQNPHNVVFQKDKAPFYFESNNEENSQDFNNSPPTISSTPENQLPPKIGLKGKIVRSLSATFLNAITHLYSIKTKARKMSEDLGIISGEETSPKKDDFFPEPLDLNNVKRSASDSAWQNELYKRSNEHELRPKVFSRGSKENNQNTAFDSTEGEILIPKYNFGSERKEHSSSLQRILKQKDKHRTKNNLIENYVLRSQARQRFLQPKVRGKQRKTGSLKDIHNYLLLNKSSFMSNDDESESKPKKHQSPYHHRLYPEMNYQGKRSYVGHVSPERKIKAKTSKNYSFRSRLQEGSNNTGKYISSVSHDHNALQKFMGANSLNKSSNPKTNSPFPRHYKASTQDGSVTSPTFIKDQNSGESNIYHPDVYLSPSTCLEDNLEQAWADNDPDKQKQHIDKRIDKQTRNMKDKRNNDPDKQKQLIDERIDKQTRNMKDKRNNDPDKQKQHIDKRIVSYMKDKNNIEENNKTKSAKPDFISPRRTANPKDSTSQTAKQPHKHIHVDNSKNTNPKMSQPTMTVVSQYFSQTITSAYDKIKSFTETNVQDRPAYPNEKTLVASESEDEEEITKISASTPNEKTLVAPESEDGQALVASQSKDEEKITKSSAQATVDSVRNLTNGSGEGKQSPHSHLSRIKKNKIPRERPEKVSKIHSEPFLNESGQRKLKKGRHITTSISEYKSPHAVLGKKTTGRNTSEKGKIYKKTVDKNVKYDKQSKSDDVRHVTKSYSSRGPTIMPRMIDGNSDQQSDQKKTGVGAAVATAVLGSTSALSIYESKKPSRDGGVEKIYEDSGCEKRYLDQNTVAALANNEGYIAARRRAEETKCEQKKSRLWNKVVTCEAEEDETRHGIGAFHSSPKLFQSSRDPVGFANSAKCTGRTKICGGQSQQQPVLSRQSNVSVLSMVSTTEEDSLSAICEHHYSDDVQYKVKRELRKYDSRKLSQNVRSLGTRVSRDHEGQERDGDRGETCVKDIKLPGRDSMNQQFESISQSLKPCYVEQCKSETDKFQMEQKRDNDIKNSTNMRRGRGDIKYFNSTDRDSTQSAHYMSSQNPYKKNKKLSSLSPVVDKEQISPSSHFCNPLVNGEFDTSPVYVERPSRGSPSSRISSTAFPFLISNVRTSDSKKSTLESCGGPSPSPSAQEEYSSREHSVGDAHKIDECENIDCGYADYEQDEKLLAPFYNLPSERYKTTSPKSSSKHEGICHHTSPTSSKSSPRYGKHSRETSKTSSPIYYDDPQYRQSSPLRVSSDEAHSDDNCGNRVDGGNQSSKGDISELECLKESDREHSNNFENESDINSAFEEEDCKDLYRRESSENEKDDQCRAKRDFIEESEDDLCGNIEKKEESQDSRCSSVMSFWSPQSNKK